MSNRFRFPEATQHLIERVDRADCSGTNPILVLGQTPGIASLAAATAAAEFSDDVLVLSPSSDSWKIDELRNSVVSSLQRAGKLPITVIQAVDRTDVGSAVLLKALEDSSTFAWLCADNLEGVDPALLGRVERVFATLEPPAEVIDEYLASTYPDLAVPSKFVRRDPNLLHDVDAELLEQLVDLLPSDFASAYTTGMAINQAKLDRSLTYRLVAAWCAYNAVPKADTQWALTAAHRRVLPRVIFTTLVGQRLPAYL